MLISLTQLKAGITVVGVGGQFVTGAPQYEDFMRKSVGIPFSAGVIAQISIKLMTVSPTGPIVGPGDVISTVYVNDAPIGTPVVLHAENTSMVKGTISMIPIPNDGDLVSIKVESTLPDNVAAYAAYIAYNSWAAYMNREPPRR